MTHLAALAHDAATRSILREEGGGPVAALGEQAYALRTTRAPDTSYWMIGGDANGATGKYGISDVKDKVRDALGTAYRWWTKYSGLMDSPFSGMQMQRTERLASWRAHDAAVLKEYADLGGIGLPSP